MATTDPTIHSDVLELAALLRPAWAEMSASIPSSHPRCEDDADGYKDADADKGTADADDADADKDKSTDADKGKDPEEELRKWKRDSRKHEDRSKAEKKRADDLQAKLDKIEKSSQTDQEKAIAKAKEEAKAEAQTEADTERRADRLEGSVLRLAAKGVKVGEGKDAKTVRFDDPEDAFVFIERAVRNGDIPEATIYDDNGRPKADVIEEELVDLLKRKPNLAGGERTPDPDGISDAGKGKGKSGRSMNDLIRSAGK
jgi:hypothetical protein